MMKKKSWLVIALYILSALLFIAGVVLIIRQFVLIPGEYVEPDPTPTPTAKPTASPTPGISGTPEVTATPSPTPEPTPYVKPIPTRIYFTDRKVMCDIFPVGIITEGDREGQMATIDDPDVAAWYEPGPAPGEPGNAILNGHKSWKGKIGIFSLLWDMEPGENIAIAFEDGQVRYFRAISIDFYDHDKVPEDVMNIYSESPRLTLITCYGDFDSSIGSSVQRCVAVCVPAENYEETAADVAE